MGADSDASGSQHLISYSFYSFSGPYTKQTRSALAAVAAGAASRRVAA